MLVRIISFATIRMRPVATEAGTIGGIVDGRQLQNTVVHGGDHDRTGTKHPSESVQHAFRERRKNIELCQYQHPLGAERKELAHTVPCVRRHDRFDLLADSSTSTRMPSRPREFHPEPLTDPDRILSHHPARATARRLPPSVVMSGSSRCRLTRPNGGDPPPSLHSHYSCIIATTR